MRREIRRATTSDSVLSPGIIIGITVGGVLVITTLSLAIFFILRRRRARLQKMSHSEDSFSETQQLFPSTFSSPRIEHVDGQDFIMVSLTHEDESLVSERERSKRAGSGERSDRRYSEERNERQARVPKRTTEERYERPPGKTNGEMQERIPKKSHGEREEKMSGKTYGEQQEKTPKKSNDQNSKTRPVITSPTLKTLYLPSTQIIITPPTPISPRLSRLPARRRRRPSILPNIDEVLDENAEENENGDALGASAEDGNEDGKKSTEEIHKERNLLFLSKGMEGELSFRQRVHAQRLQRLPRAEWASLSPVPSLETLRKKAIVERLMRGKN